jgi:acyl-lipid omega-6 desaturase (Delta-12 desaturase)
MTSVLVNPSASATEDRQLDPQIRLRDILDTLPRSVFEQNPRQAWLRLLLSLGCGILGYVGLAIAPWYALPVMWFFMGTVLTGFFVIGHDCGHRSFSRKLWINDWVGHLVFLPLIYPFHAWRILHNHHHRHTNNLDEDNAWAPFTPEIYQSAPSIIQWLYRLTRGRFWWLASAIHQMKLHFAWWNFEGKQRQQVRNSALLVIVAAAIMFPLLLTTLGPWGIVKFWLMPWLGFHFWMSTFTLVHHTIPEIPFHSTANWNEAKAQLSGTVHCDYPKWVEVLCHDINVHVPHHLSTAIPSYNLRAAYRSIKENWGDYVQEETFNWALMNKITSECHVYHDVKNYESFREYLSR